MPETTYNQSLISAVECESFEGESEWIVEFPYRHYSNPKISKHPSASEKTQNIDSAKLGHFQSPFSLHTQSSEVLISNSSEFEGNAQQQNMNFTEASSSGYQAVRESPSMQKIKICNMKSLEIISRKSLEINGGAHSSVGASKKSQIKLDKLKYNQGFKAKKKNHMGGAISLLLDAIQLVEDEDQLKGGKKNGKGISHRPGLESHQCHETDYSNPAKKMIPYEVSHIRDFQNNPLIITEGNDREHGAKPEVQARRKRLQALPSKYSDSLLLPWK
ncbi:hypothetical protein SUGI_0997070 [Cryptomeria japonica]|uniref:uncharacterized protein LOC131072536 isoform X1 n=1 Tax=Cryptomeria japonica TaxID=3369 RepID=UPI0024148615|nr:uncharacterized protein LOC131072536 isoform X1 [Cryptomeria japonica]GLJ47233.1 hypothetical protein SUGI_0997070 [Cryptomeria japonica]